MSESGKLVRQHTGTGASARSFLFALLFGFAFGFLLQKGGVGKYNVLIGQLLLQDWTVAKVMMSAIVVGMIGIFVLHRFGKVKLHIKPTRLGSNIIGGLVFGAGFALIGYCPGTAAAALGQGSWDALFGMAGLIVGSFLYAEFSHTLKNSVEKWGDRGRLLIPDALGLSRGTSVVIVAAVLIALLIALEKSAVR